MPKSSHLYGSAGSMTYGVGAAANADLGRACKQDVIIQWNGSYSVKQHSCIYNFTLYIYILMWLVWPVPLAARTPTCLVLKTSKGWCLLYETKKCCTQNHQRLASISQTLLPNGTTGWLYLFLQTAALEPVGNDRGSLAAASEAPEMEGTIEWAWRRLWTCMDKPKACWQNQHSSIF
jgi:hypothetical protein